MGLQNFRYLKDKEEYHNLTAISRELNATIITATKMMNISCRTCKHYNGLGCSIRWILENEMFECIDREYHFWERIEIPNRVDFITREEMEL